MAGALRVRCGSLLESREGNKPRFSPNLQMPVNEELGEGGRVREVLGGGNAGLDACRFGERVGDEIAQSVAGAHLHEEPDSVVIPEGLDIIHPMDGGFQVGHQDSPDLAGI